MQRFAYSNFSRNSLLLFNSSLTMFMLYIRRYDMEESHPPLPFLKEGTGNSLSSIFYSILLILDGDSDFLGDCGALLMGILS